jgi:Zn-dependent metalloprotease
MITVKLKVIERDVDFRSTEATQFTALVAGKGVKIADGEVAVLISKSKNQVVFVFGQWGEDKPTTVSMRFRLPAHAVWSDYTLADYAKRVGLKIANFPTLAQWLAHAKAVKGAGNGKSAR